MTVLVTGGAGYIGSHMVHALADAGERVVVLDNLTTGFDWSVPPDVSLVVGDTGDQARVAALLAEHRVDAIIHFAASIVVPDSVRDPLGYYKNNTANARSLIEMAVKHGVKHFIFSSTAAVYGNPAQVPVTEDTPPMPVSPYGWSKLMTEQMLRDTAVAHGLGHVILRYFNVAGSDPEQRTGQSTPDATHLIKVACETALGSEIRGEGLIGLTRGFLYAGAPRVVATLWKVDDRATSEVMKRFYEAMLKRGERPAAALRSAQAAMSKTKGWDAPHNWAAFTIQGEWR
jgi:UDP-glucose 4-epimerase